MLLLLMRHGIAEDIGDASDQEDFSRRLTAKGRRRVREVAHLLDHLKVKPTHYTSSPRRRAVQTAEIVAAEIAGRRRITQLASLDFDGQWHQFVADIQELTGGSSRAVVLAAGHEPCCSDFLTQALQPVQHSFPVKKGAVVALEWSGTICEREAAFLFYLTSRMARQTP